MVINNIALRNEMIDIKENHFDNGTRDNLIVQHNSYGDGSDDSSNNFSEKNNTSNNVDDRSIISDDNSDSSNEQMYPSDCYSFLSLYGPIKTPVYFFFGLAVCLFQLAFLILFVLSVLHKNFSSKGDVDNPDDGLLAQFIHADADPLVRATQVLAIISYSLFAESSLQDVVTAVETFPRFDTATNDDKTRRVIFSCLLRFIQGGMAIFSSFVLVVNSSNVIEIILNFTAVNFISNIDDVAFLLARSGKYGSKLEEGATSITNHPLPTCMSRSTKNRRFCYTIMFTLLLMLAFIFAIMYAQVSDKFWRTTTFRVEFDEETGLDAFTGCYKLDEAQSSGLLEKKRKIYTNSKDTSSALESSIDTVQFGYCREDRRWIMYKGNMTDPCLAGEAKLAQSIKTQSFDISTSYGDTWTSVSGSPLDLYFIDLNNKTLGECKSFENGICDDNFNSMNYRYDGGDCCAATCSQPFCGLGNLTEAFGVAVNISGDGFPDCKDPSMVPITIHVQDFVSSAEPQYVFPDDFGYDADFRKNLTSKFGDLEGIRSNFEELFTWLNANDPTGRSWNPSDLSVFFNSDVKVPSLNLYCDQKNVISILMDKSMEDNFETLMVEDGAECTLEIENTPNWDESIWYFNYTIYHDEAMQVKIDEGTSFEDGTKQFIRIKDCFLDAIFGYGYDFEDMNYSDLTRRFNWIVEHDVGNQPCSSDFSMERYALTLMNMVPINITSNVSDDSELWMNDDMHCMWSSVECSQGFVVVLDLTQTKSISEYTIPTEIGMVSNLEKLNLDDTLLIGSIPTEIGLLTTLEYIDLGNNELTGSIPAEIGLLTELGILVLRDDKLTGPIPTEVGLLTNLTSLWLGWNKFTSSIPIEVGNMVLLEILNLNDNKFEGSIPSELGLLTKLWTLNVGLNELTGPIPTEVGSLTILDDLNFAENELTGSIPTEVGVLTRLTNLSFSGNKLTGPIPTEIGLLTDLTWLQLGNNELTGPIPTEIGLLTELTWLDLDGNELTGPIPTEISLLTDLTTLFLYGNELTGQIPTEISLLADLTMLDLTGNELTGPIPTEIGLLTELTWLDLDGNELSGPIPTEVDSLTTLRSISIGDNELTGPIPTEIGLLAALESLNLDGNNLTGSIPTEVGSLTTLRYISIDDNKCEGSIPSELGLLTSLRSLDLGGNLLTATVPSELAQLVELYEISLDLTGILPFSNLTAFEKIYVYNSSITTESIPTSLLVEPCKLCDDNGTFVYKETENATSFDDYEYEYTYGDLLLNDTVIKHYNCTEEVEGLNAKNNHSEGWTSMLSIDECTELKEQCIDCYLLV